MLGKLALNADKAIEVIRAAEEPAHVDGIVGIRRGRCRSAEEPEPFP